MYVNPTPFLKLTVPSVLWEMGLFAYFRRNVLASFRNDCKNKLDFTAFLYRDPIYIFWMCCSRVTTPEMLLISCFRWIKIAIQLLWLDRADPDLVLTGLHGQMCGRKFVKFNLLGKFRHVYTKTDNIWMDFERKMCNIWKVSHQHCWEWQWWGHASTINFEVGVWNVKILDLAVEVGINFHWIFEK